jgi:hypothetical protein
MGRTRGNWNNQAQAIEVVFVSMHKMSTERARDVKQALRGVLQVHSEFMADPNQLVRAASDLELMNMKSKSIIQGQIGTYR